MISLRSEIKENPKKNHEKIQVYSNALHPIFSAETDEEKDASCA